MCGFGTPETKEMFISKMDRHSNGIKSEYPRDKITLNIMVISSASQTSQLTKTQNQPAFEVTYLTYPLPFQDRKKTEYNIL